MNRSRYTPRPESVRFNKWMLVAAVCLSTCFAATARAAEDIDLPRLIQALDDWRGRFSNISFVYDSWWRKQLEKRFPELRGKPLDGYYRRTTWTWSDTGKVRENSQSFLGGVEEQSQQSGADGTTNYRADLVPAANFHESGRKERGELRIFKAPTERPLASNFTESALFGLWISGEGIWVADQLRREQPSVETMEHDGRQMPTAKLDRARFYFDPEHDFLPCYVQPDAPTKQRAGWEWKVTEWGHHETDLVYPARGTFHPNINPKDDFVDWVVREVNLNQSLSPTFFSPPQPTDGMLVSDSVNAKLYRHGGKKTPTEEVAKAANPPVPSNNTTRPEGNPNKVAVAAGRWWFWLTVLASATCLVGAYVTRRGRRAGR